MGNEQPKMSHEKKPDKEWVPGSVKERAQYLVQSVGEIQEMIRETESRNDPGHEGVTSHAIESLREAEKTLISLGTEMNRLKTFIGSSIDTHKKEAGKSAELHKNSTSI